MRLVSKSLFVIWVGILNFSCQTHIEQTRGHLVIIGGGERTEQIMSRILELAGGDSARILIVPNASSDLVETAQYQQKQFYDYGAAQVDYVNLTRENVDADSNLALLDGKTGIFFSGGSQSRLTPILLDSEFLKRIRGIYAAGGLLSGTSAGAAIMSNLMLTGNELIWDDSTRNFATIQIGNIEATQGFGFIEDVIIDQHFVRRKRHNRLISLVLENPDQVGIAIDESTAIVSYPNGNIEVLGEYTVLIYDARKSTNISTDKNGNLAGSDLSFNILKSGDRFDVLNGKVILK